MRALRTSITAPIKATRTAPTKKYFSTSALFQTRRSPESQSRKLDSSKRRFCLSELRAQQVTRGIRQTEIGVIPELRDVNVEYRSDLAKCGVDISCQGVHPDNGSEGNQGND